MSKPQLKKEITELGFPRVSNFQRKRANFSGQDRVRSSLAGRGRKPPLNASTFDRDGMIQ